jgi:hypothetical protein
MAAEGQVMANGSKVSNDQDPNFSFGTRELRDARRAEALAVEEPPGKIQNADAGGGFDPYNSSGSFDRRKHWERVPKR